jgi:hypothetical protein
VADHNDPNAVNSIFSDIDVSAADCTTFSDFRATTLRAMKKVVIGLTFAAVPQVSRGLR